jgi:hypothetical protein
MHIYSLLRLFNNGNQEIPAVRASSVTDAARAISLAAPLPLDADGYARDIPSGISYCVAYNYGTK